MFYDGDAAKIGKIILFPYIAFAPMCFLLGVYILYLLVL